MLTVAQQGTDCPCCGRYIQIYKRAITPAMAKVLGLLEHAARTSDAYHHLQTLIASTEQISAHEKTKLRGDFGKLRFWLLISGPPEGHLGKPKAKWKGYWRITELGRDFVAAKIRIPKYKYLLKNSELDVEVLETVSFEEALRGRRPKAPTGEAA
jgi:hypothetical protein